MAIIQRADEVPPFRVDKFARDISRHRGHETSTFTFSDTFKFSKRDRSLKLEINKQKKHKKTVYDKKIPHTGYIESLDRCG